MNNKPNITIIIPCHQFDDRVEKSIASAQWASEVLMIDQNSNIDWAILRKQYHFRVIEHHNLTSFSEMKNQAMKEVKTEWVFFLDSDEFITKQLATEIQHNIENGSCDALIVTRRDIFLNKVLFHGETRSANFIRIVKTKIGEWIGTVHEELIVAQSNNKIETLHSPLYHEPHPSIHEFMQKVNFYTSLLAEQEKEKHIFLKSIFLPVGKFFYTFIIRQGFLDGYRGLIYSFIMSIHSNAVRIKRYERH